MAFISILKNIDEIPEPIQDIKAKEGSITINNKYRIKYKDAAQYHFDLSKLHIKKANAQ